MVQSDRTRLLEALPLYLADDNLQLGVAAELQWHREHVAMYQLAAQACPVCRVGAVLGKDWNHCSGWIV